MRMGKASRRVKGSSQTLAPDRPKYASRGLVVGQLQSNVVASVYWPQIVDIANDQLERHAELMMEYDDEVQTIVEDRRKERELKRLESEGDDDDKYNLDDVDIEEEEGDDENGDAAKEPPLYADLPPPPTPASRLLFHSPAQLDDLSETILSPHLDHFTKTAEWKVYANAAKFERLLDERYGPFRPFVDKYPQIERTVRNMQRKYAKGNSPRPTGRTAHSQIHGHHYFVYDAAQCREMGGVGARGHLLAGGAAALGAGGTREHRT